MSVPVSDRPRAEIIVTPQVANQGTIIVAIAGDVKVTITSDTRPAGSVVMELEISPENGSPSFISYLIAFRDGQSYGFDHSWGGSVVAGTLEASGPGLNFEISAATEGAKAEESGTL